MIKRNYTSIILVSTKQNVFSYKLGQRFLSFDMKSVDNGNSIAEVIKSNEMVKTFNNNNIRNFSVIAHVDHGKSTLSDSLLQYTGSINEKERKKGQVLDTLQVERDRGITVKAQSASMVFTDLRSNQRYLLNLIDTPGHVDFSYEVTRSLASCQGALLLVDSTQSIQAQTLSNYNKAIQLDLPTSQPIEVAIEMGKAFSLDPDSVIMTSAKKNIGIKEVFEAVIDRIPPPNRLELDNNHSNLFIGRVVDSWFDDLRGVICLIQVLNGNISEGQRISIISSYEIDKYSLNQTDYKIDSSDFSIQEIGYLTPQAIRSGHLSQGHVGYVVSGIRSTKQARVGDIVYLPSQISYNLLIPQLSTALPLYLSNQSSTNTTTQRKSSLPDNLPMLYVSIYPVDSTEVDKLIDAVDRLCLTDPSVSVKKEQSASLGVGLRVGFLGYLHMEVFTQRLQDDYNIQVVVTTPSVPYLIRYIDIDDINNNNNNSIKGFIDIQSNDKIVSNLSEWPENATTSKLFHIFEPIVQINLQAPSNYYGDIVDLLKQRRAYDIEVTYIEKSININSNSNENETGNLDIIINCLIPWQEVVFDLHDQIKHLTSGYSSFSYIEKGYVKSDLVKVDLYINNEKCNPLSMICHTSKASDIGRGIALKLKDVLTRQQFEINIQAKINTKVLAKERIAPYRKDVLARSGKTVGGGDVTRKKKLLEKQKEGKKRAKMVGRVEISQEAFWSVLQK